MAQSPSGTRLPRWHLTRRFVGPARARVEGLGSGGRIRLPDRAGARGARSPGPRAGLYGPSRSVHDDLEQLAGVSGARRGTGFLAGAWIRERLTDLPPLLEAQPLVPR